ncbi:MAG: amino acid deaminase/aldolase [Proteobacteria bacterium]|nr:amino acid deaminase/aldolase [Pseudomonadota bacterium]
MMNNETEKEYFRYKETLRGTRLPLAFVDLEKFDRNVDFVASTQENTGKTIRVHTKSIRCLALLRRVFEKGGSRYKGIMTISMEEAAYLAEQGFDDIIVAYPTVQLSEINRLVKMTKEGKTVCLMIDSIEHLKILSKAGKRAGVVLHVCLEVDMAYRPLKTPLHLGVRRSPVRSVEDAIMIARKSLKYKWVVVDAIMGYEGHIASSNDAVPNRWVKNVLTRTLKKASITEFTERRANVIKELRKAGLNLRIVNGGGSGSLVSTGRDPSVTEVTAGSAFYAPGLFWYFKDVAFEPSAFFAIQVVRKPRAGMVTCQGGGYVASGAVGVDKQPVPVYPDGLKFLPLEGAGEVQTPFTLPAGCPELNLGDPVILQHAKGGELSERFNEFHLIEKDKIVDTVNTYRGDGYAFI